MSRLAPHLLGIVIVLSVLTPLRAFAGYVPLGEGQGFYTGVDAGVGPNDPAPNSAAQATLFQGALGKGSFTTIDFGPSFTGLVPSANGVWSQGGNGLSVMTQGISYATPPSPYQYGITSGTDSINNNSDIGFSVGGTHHYAFVPVLDTGTASFTIRSDTAFESFGFYLTGLGNQNGVVNVLINGKAISGMVPLTGSKSGGELFFGYVGDTSINSLSIVMPGVTGPTRDVFGISNVMLFSPVPEPSSVVLTGLGLAGLLCAYVRRSRRLALA